MITRTTPLIWAAMCGLSIWATPISSTTKTEESHANIEYGVEENSGCRCDTGHNRRRPFGEHSLYQRAFAKDCEKNGPIHVVQIDAHLDFVDERHGVTEGHGNPMRRAIEKDYVSGMTQLGIRNVSSTAKEGYDDARARGSDILSVRQVRKLGHGRSSGPHPRRGTLLCHH